MFKKQLLNVLIGMIIGGFLSHVFGFLIFIIICILLGVVGWKFGIL